MKKKSKEIPDDLLQILALIDRQQKKLDIKKEILKNKNLKVKRKEFSNKNSNKINELLQSQLQLKEKLEKINKIQNILENKQQNLTTNNKNSQKDDLLFIQNQLNGIKKDLSKRRESFKLFQKELTEIKNQLDQKQKESEKIIKQKFVKKEPLYKDNTDFIEDFIINKKTKHSSLKRFHKFIKRPKGKITLMSVFTIIILIVGGVNSAFLYGVGFDNLKSGYSYTLICSPILANETPSDGATDVSLSMDNYSINITHPSSENMNITWRTNESGSWVTFNTTNGGDGNGVLNGTFYANNTAWVDTGSTTYWWSVNVSDGTWWTNETYSFTTEASLTTYYINITSTSLLDGTIELYYDLFDMEWAYLKDIIKDEMTIGYDSNGAGAEDDEYYRGFVEWDVSDIHASATIIDVDFKYHGKLYDVNCKVYNMTTRPSENTNEGIYDDAADGSLYYFGKGDFPIVGESQEIDLGDDAVNDLQNATYKGEDRWFAIGIISVREDISDLSEIYCSDYKFVNPEPTLKVTYTN